MIKKILKWTALVVLVLAAGGFLAFLYFIPPFFTLPQETFTKTMQEAAPPVADIANPAERAVAQRGRDIVVRTACIGCHAASGAQGPDYSKYLAGGGLKIVAKTGAYVSRNLTPDPETGLARRTDEQVKRVLRSGVFPDGHVAPYTVMPWANFSNWTEEDRHAVMVYLRHIKPVRQQIPEPVLIPSDLDPGVVEVDYASKDYSVH